MARQIYTPSAAKAMQVPLKKSPHLASLRVVFFASALSASPPRKYSASIKGQLRLLSKALKTDLNFRIMKWFNDCKTIEEVKAAYKKLAKENHPDLGGDTATMQDINKEYAFASAKAIKGANLSEEETESQILSSEAYRQAIEKIIHIDGIVIELVGFWIWVTGDTYTVKAELKDAGFFFASKKLAWYFRTAEFKVAKGGKKTLNEIRNKYGSEVINDDKKKRNYIN